MTLHDVKQALIESNRHTTGGYLDEQGPNELLVRALGRVQTAEDLKKLVITIRDERPVSFQQVARVQEAVQVKRGDSSAFVRESGDEFSGDPAVVLTVNQQPNADAREVTDAIKEALVDLKPSLPEDIRIETVYSQRAFIDRAIHNVIEALADGGVLVVVLLFIFLMNFRTTFITLTAIPLSVTMTALIFAAFGFSINTMTLGGLDVAIGELVDDAIVDVEYIFRRLRENMHRPEGERKNPLLVVFQASAEIRKDNCMPAAEDSHHEHDEHDDHHNHADHLHGLTRGQEMQGGSDARLLWPVLLNHVLTLGQVVADMISDSIALLSDAAHNFNDANALLIAYIARRISRKEANQRYTFGYRKFLPIPCRRQCRSLTRRQVIVVS